MLLTFDTATQCFVGRDVTVTVTAYLAAFQGLLADGLACATAQALV